MAVVGTTSVPRVGTAFAPGHRSKCLECLDTKGSSHEQAADCGGMFGFARRLPERVARDGDHIIAVAR
jgi:hypothetical protein